MPELPSCSCPTAAAPANPGRRRFLTWLGVAVAALLVPLPAWARRVAVKLGKITQLGTVGGWATVKVAGRELLLIRESASQVRAVSARCTHEQTRLTYQASAREIVCPRHGSRFSLTGQVRKGPAAKALGTLDASLDQQRQRIVIDLGGS